MQIQIILLPLYCHQEETLTQKNMNNFKLAFGKYKGQDFLSTPKSYQDWLLNQDWFKAPTQTIISKPNKEYYMRDGKIVEYISDDDFQCAEIEFENSLN